MKIISTICFVFMLSGCSLFRSLSGEVASGVVRYCEQPYEVRKLISQQINMELSPYNHVLHTHCFGDPEETE